MATSNLSILLAKTILASKTILPGWFYDAKNFFHHLAIIVHF